MKISRYNIVCMTGAILSASAISIISEWQTSNIITGMIAIVLYCFYKEQRPSIGKGNKRIVIAAIVGGIWSFFMMLKGLESFDNYPSVGAIGKISILFCILAGFFILFFYIIYFIYTKMMNVVINEQKEKKTSQYKVFLLGLIVILLCWLPYYCSYYPGIVISDSCDQINQALTGVYSNHHPVIQTWMIQGVLTIGLSLFSNLNAAVALYCVLQMIILAAIYSYTISTFYKYGIRTWICIIIMAFYAIVPYNVMFSFNMWKDSLFSVFVLLFSVVLWKILIDMELGINRKNIGDILLLLISGLGICLFRNNGFYTFLLAAPFICVICWRKQRKIVITIVGILLLTGLVKGPIFNYFKVASPDPIESLSIPTQQIARVISEGLEISEGQKLLLNEIVEVDKIPQTYDKRISDPIKGLVREHNNQEFLEEHKTEYLKLWIELGIQYPFQYLRAYMNQTEGYWNPDVQNWVYADSIFNTQLDIHSNPLLSDNMSKRLKWFIWENYQDIPIYGILWSIGGGVWMTMLLAGFCYIKGKKSELCLFVPIGALWGTIMAATPVYAEFRYIYAIFLCMPLFIAASLYETKN